MALRVAGRTGSCGHLSLSPGDGRRLQNAAARSVRRSLTGTEARCANGAWLSCLREEGTAFLNGWELCSASVPRSVSVCRLTGQPVEPCGRGPWSGEKKSSAADDFLFRNGGSSGAVRLWSYWSGAGGWMEAGEAILEWWRRRGVAGGGGGGDRWRRQLPHNEAGTSSSLSFNLCHR